MCCLKYIPRMEWNNEFIEQTVKLCTNKRINSKYDKEKYFIKIYWEQQKILAFETTSLKSLFGFGAKKLEL